MSAATRTVAVRIVNALITLWLAATAAFLLARLSGDPARQLAGDNAPEAQVEAVRVQLGLDEPLVVQYIKFLGDLITLDLGNSIVYGAANADLILTRIPYSLQLAGVALLIAIVVAIPLGVLAATHEGRWIDRATSAIALIGQSAPLFWIGMMAILLFSQTLGWFPAGQARAPLSLVLPACTLALLPLSQIARLTRSSMSEVLAAPFVDALRARGFSRARVTYLHALRNASLPVITIIGLQAGQLISAAVTIEVIFAWPGIGSLAVDAAAGRDFPLVQAIVVAGAAAFVVINLLVDMLYAVIDPRTRTGR